MTASMSEPCGGGSMLDVAAAAANANAGPNVDLQIETYGW
jgi:hypothetical protein